MAHKGQDFDIENWGLHPGSYVVVGTEYTNEIYCFNQQW